MRHAREGAQAEYYRQFSFRPAINPHSRQLAQVCAAASCAASKALRDDHTISCVWIVSIRSLQPVLQDAHEAWP